ncbi:PAS domain-containing protein [uncultured Nisaea sp.]|uniref:PAS domain-containing protein n=1 Tax=uncultured Nisaea sp. TaxID=538215 RepID=UPI0030EE6C48|tara:strand:- start:735 stop:1319 length:585 start_codon:yes stop_codon:yes gene_type:complete
MTFGDTGSPVGEALDQIAGRLRTESTRLLLQHWRSIMEENRLPSRNKIDPSQLAPVLPSIWLCDFMREENRFRYRLTGEKVAKRFGHKLSKHYLDDLTDPSYYPRVHRYYRNAVDFPAVLYIYGRLYAETANPIHGERILLPLSDDGLGVHGLIGATAEIIPRQNREAPYLPEFQKHVYVTLETGAIVEESLPV